MNILSADESDINVFLLLLFFFILLKFCQTERLGNTKESSRKYTHSVTFLSLPPAEYPVMNAAFLLSRQHGEVNQPPPPRPYYPDTY